MKDALNVVRKIMMVIMMNNYNHGLHYSRNYFLPVLSVLFIALWVATIGSTGIIHCIVGRYNRFYIDLNSESIQVAVSAFTHRLHVLQRHSNMLGGLPSFVGTHQSYGTICSAW